MLHDANLLSLLRSRRPDGPLPGAFYASAEAYEADLRHVWGREWIFAAPAAELAEPGRFVTLQVGPWPVIVVRGADGEVRAFHNVCRHRGSRICTTEAGTAHRLVCPYHRWTYDLGGRLLWARDMEAGFEKGEHSLLPVHVAVAAGMTWICLADEAPDFAPVKAAADRYAAPHRLDELKVAHRSSIVEHANWKLTMENNRECYHCAGSHPALCVSFDVDPDLVGADDSLSSPRGAAHVARCEAAGLPSRYLIGSNEEWRLVRIPLAEGAVSYTMDGSAAVAGGLPGIPFADAGTLLFFHYPNTWNHFLSDHVLTFRVLPRGPAETEVVTTWLVHRDAQEGLDYDVTRLTEVWEATNAEDARVVEETQRGVSSPAWAPGPYSMKQESGVLQFVGWYARALERGLARSGRAMAAEQAGPGVHAGALATQRGP